MAGPLTSVAIDIVDVLEDDELRHVAGMAGKSAALDVASEDLGADRSFSGFRRKVPLKAGYDETPTGVDLNLWPEGLWTLADKGRKAKAYRTIPRKGRRRRKSGRRPAVMTPAGPRWSARITSSKPLNTLSTVERRLADEVPDAIGDHLTKKFRGL